MFNLFNGSKLTHLEKEIKLYDKKYTYEDSEELIIELKGVLGYTLIQLNWALDDETKIQIKNHFKNKI